MRLTRMMAFNAMTAFQNNYSITMNENEYKIISLTYGDTETISNGNPNMCSVGDLVVHCLLENVLDAA